MFAQVRRCLPLSQRKLLIWRKRLKIWFCSLRLISLRCCRGNTKSFRSLQVVYLEFSKTLVNLDSLPLFNHSTWYQSLSNFLSALWCWRVVRFKHLTAGFTAAVIPAVADADKDGNSDNPADQSDGKVVETSCASLSISTQTEGEAQWLRLEFVGCCKI